MLKLLLNLAIYVENRINANEWRDVAEVQRL